MHDSSSPDQTMLPSTGIKQHCKVPKTHVTEKPKIQQSEMLKWSTLFIFIYWDNHKVHPE